MFRKTFGGLGLLVLSLFYSVSVALAADPVDPYPSFGPQTFDVNKYYYFGDSEYSATSQQGLSLSIDPSSTSFQSIKGTLTMDWNIIMDRKITEFIILANGVAVDYVEPFFDTKIDPPTYREYYYLDINITTQYIGSDVYFQVLGISKINSENAYVVAWSPQTDTYHFKPLPVTDSDTHGWLSDILDKLQELLDSLKAKLDALTEAVEAIYTPTPSKEAAMDSAMDNLIEKMPMKELADEMTQLTDAMEEAKRNLQEPGAQLLLTERVDLIPGEGIYWEVDATEWRTEILLFRTIIAAVLWLSFFYYLQSLITPKPNI